MVSGLEALTFLSRGGDSLKMRKLITLRIYEKKGQKRGSLNGRQKNSNFIHSIEPHSGGFLVV